MNAFLAITVRFSTDEFFEDARTNAVEFYKNAARNILFRQVAEPTGSLDVLQSFCLLCLSEIYGRSSKSEGVSHSNHLT